MRKLKLTLVLAFAGMTAIAQNTIQVKAKTEKATIYLSQAMIENSVPVNLPAGRSKIIVENIANTIDPNSIQIGGKGDFTLLGVQHLANYLSTTPLKLQDSIDQVSIKIEDVVMLQGVVTNERTMLMANANIKGDSKNLTPAELNEMAENFRKKLTEIGTRELKLKREKEALEKDKARLIRQMNELNQSKLPLGVLEISVSASKAVKGSLEISYIAYNAGWTPSYDLRVKDTHSDVQIVQKAKVFQNTGLNWDNISLSLSTTNPSVSATKPELYPYYLNYNRPVPRVMRDSDVAARTMLKTAAAPSVVEAEMTSAADFVNVVSTSLSVEFQIDMPFSLPSGGKPEVVDIQNLSNKATYKTYITPKLNKNAYLMAELEGWENLNLISGEASIYFENKYVGKTYISEQKTDDLLKISLGRDTRIVAERKPIENYKSKKALGSNIREDFGYKISVKNLKNEPVTLVLEDQIPVSQDSKIEVSITDISGGKLNEADGKIVWDIKLGASENKELLLKYQVKYPKDNVPVGL